MLLQHDVDHGLRAVVDAFQVDVDDTVELVLRHLFQLGVLHDARIVDEGVDAAPLCHDAFDHPGNALLVRYVNAEGESFAAGVGDFAGYLRRRRLVDVADRDLGAFAAELEGRGMADARTGSRYDRDLVRETHAL